MWQIGIKGDETTTQKMENIEVKYPNTIIITGGFKAKIYTYLYSLNGNHQRAGML